MLKRIRNFGDALTVHAQSLLARTSREEGQGMVEYALILVLIAIVVIVVLAVVGHQVSDVFNNINSGLS